MTRITIQIGSSDGIVSTTWPVAKLHLFYDFQSPNLHIPSLKCYVHTYVHTYRAQSGMRLNLAIWLCAAVITHLSFHIHNYVNTHTYMYVYTYILWINPIQSVVNVHTRVISRTQHPPLCHTPANRWLLCQWRQTGHLPCPTLPHPFSVPAHHSLTLGGVNRAHTAWDSLTPVALQRGSLGEGRHSGRGAGML